MLQSAVRRILAGLALLPLAVGGGLVAFDAVFRTADATAWYLALFLAALAVPVAGVLLLGGTIDGVRVLRSQGWRDRPLGSAVVAAGAAGAMSAVLVLLLFPARCLGR